MGVSWVNKNHEIIKRLQEPTFQQQNFAYNKIRITTFKMNVVYVLNQEGISIRSFFRELNASGIRLSREGWINGTRSNPPSSLVITTFARVLNVPEAILFSEDIASVYVPTGYKE